MNDLQLTIHTPIKLTGTLEGDVIIKITKARFQTSLKGVSKESQTRLNSE